MILGEKFLTIVHFTLPTAFLTTSGLVERIAEGLSVDAWSSTKLEKERREKLEATTEISNHHNTVVHCLVIVDIIILSRIKRQFNSILHCSCVIFFCGPSSGLTRAVNKTRKRVSSCLKDVFVAETTNQNSLICWTEDHHQVQHYSVWQKWITVRAVHYFRTNSKLNQQCLKSKCQL